MRHWFGGTGQRLSLGESHTAVRLSFAALLLPWFLLGCERPDPSDLVLGWQEVPDRPWPGPELWANRLQDWEVRGGKLIADGMLPMRTAHILTRGCAPEAGEILASLTMGLSRPTGDREETGGGVDLLAGGLLLGAGGAGSDYRRSALVHHSPGPGGGLFVGVDGRGQLFVADFADGNRILAVTEDSLSSTDSLELRIEVRRESGTVEGGAPRNTLILASSARSLDGPGISLAMELPGIPDNRLQGGMALVSNGNGASGTQVWFSAFRMEGPGVQAHPGRLLGPILGAQYSLSRAALTLTAQLLPVSPLNPGRVTASGDTVLLELQDEEGTWVHRASAPVLVPGYTATFHLSEWLAREPVHYRLSLRDPATEVEAAPYQGTLQADPVGGESLVVAAFTGNHNVASPGVDQGSFNWEKDVWFPHEDIVGHVADHAPDLLFFSGDQVYEGASPTRADFQHPYGDYLYKWYLWLWAFRDLTARIPSIAIPDDHDVFHGNVWGAGGKATPPGLTGAAAQDQGGYRLPADWVNMVQRTQASHLPIPWDPTASDQGIEAYFTDLLFGGVSFAVLEDRKFKSPPKLLLPEAEIWNGWAQNPDFDPRTEADPPGASLLGPAQERFLEQWASDWSGGTWMKVVLSQTIFGNVATIPSSAMNGSVIPELPIPEPGVLVPGDKLAADMDSNGWPPGGRDRALRAMRKGFAVHLAGDQHLASTIQYGVDTFGDGPFALCVPSVANFWPRRWYPPEPGGNRNPGTPSYTGDFLDGFGNPMTVLAVSNPARWGKEPTNLHDRAPGYGIARFERDTREVSLEAWPRWADPGAGGSPYPGWPIRFRQEDGYGKEAWGYLPTLVVEGLADPVVQVISELGGEVVYSIRIRGSRFTPKVFESGSYTLRLGEPGTDAMRTILGLLPAPDSLRSLEIRFDRPPS